MEKSIQAKAIGVMPGIANDLRWVNDLKRGRVPGPRTEHHKWVDSNLGLSTKAVHAGNYIDPITGAVCTPMFHATTFLFGNHTYASFSEGVTRDVPIYTRYGNPSQWSVQEKIASLEGAESAVLFASGMAAIASTVQALTNRGGHIITSRDLYGGTYNYMREDAGQIGREVTYVDPTDFEEIKRSVRPNTQLLFFETLTNPLLKAIPLVELAKFSDEHNLLLVLDNTFLSPICLRPLEFGAHVVIHSCTKYINGHSDVVAGVASGSRKYVDRIWAQMLKSGGCLDPHACAWLERGIKTLTIRMKAHVENANRVAAYLSNHPKIACVHHPSLDGYPYQWVREYCSEFGGVVSFELKGGDEAALRLLGQLSIPEVATSLGGVESLVSLPFNTSHSTLTVKQRKAIGIAPGLVRYSVGIEDADDLIADLRSALECI